MARAPKRSPGIALPLCAALLAVVLSPMADAQAVWADSPKRGLGMPLADDVQQRNLTRLEELNVDWFYSWSAEPRSGFEALPTGIDFIPMAWGRNSPANHLNTWIAGRDAGLYDTLLGFNEPDLASQSNMTVTEALDLWPTLESTGLRLGSPAPASAYGPWMADFMQGVDDRGLRVDFIAVHHYGGLNTQNLLDKVDFLYQTYNLPIWITEMGVRDGNAMSPEDNRFTDQEVYDFMATVLPELESRPYVERYAWFPAERDNRFLTHSALHEDNGDLTALGRLYLGQQTQLLNPGFESPEVEPPDTLTPGAENWETFNTAGTSSEHAHDGAQSIRLAPSVAAGQSKPGIARQTFRVGTDVQINERYSVGGWVFHPSDDPLTGTRQGTLRLQWFDEAGDLLDQAIEVAIDATTPTDEWVYVTLDDVLIPDDANIDQVRVSIFVNNVGPTSVNSGAAYFDDIVFTQGSLATIPGDLDGDGDVDGNDFGIFASNFGTLTGATLSQGDLTGDGAVDGNDFGVFANSFGLGGTSAAVPEPGLAGLSSLVWLMWPRHARRVY